MLCVPFTTEDSEIIVRAAGRRNGESLHILAKMINDGNADDLRISSREEAKQLDREYAAYLAGEDPWWADQDAADWTADDELEADLEGFGNYHNSYHCP